jgi:hypothetical protein
VAAWRVEAIVGQLRSHVIRLHGHPDRVMARVYDQIG